MNRIVFSTFGFLLICITFWSCENEESLIGNDLFLTDYEVFVFPDSLIHISSTSHFDDSVTSDNSTGLLGSYFDPVFGQTDASFSFQVTLPNNEMTFDVNTITNIELNLPYTGFFGDSLTQLNIDVEQLTQSLNIEDSLDFFTSSPVFESLPIQPFSINLSEVQDSSRLTIPLATTFGLNEILNLSTDQLNNTESFTEAFYGFKLKTSPMVQGTVLYLDLASESAYLKIDYLDTSDTSQSVNFPIGAGKKFNHVAHDYSTFDISSDTTLVYLQSAGGTFAEIDFSFLEEYQDSGFVVNDATLSFSVLSEEDVFSLPEKLSLVKYENGSLGVIEGLTGGILDVDENIYEFDVTRYLQKILTNNETPICRLYTYDRTSNVDRVILTNTVDNPIKLKLILIKG